MNITDLLEAPIPDEYDKDLYGAKFATHADRNADASAKSRKLGSGSSRDAYSTIHNNQNTAFKLAKNNKGVAQNAAEIMVLTDPRVVELEITAKLIDYDLDNNDDPIWVQLEECSDFGHLSHELMGVDSLTRLVEIAHMLSGAKENKIYQQAAELKQLGFSMAEINTCMAYAEKLVKLNEWHKVMLDDFKRPANWGINSEGKPVVIDLGFTVHVALVHYKKFKSSRPKTIMTPDSFVDSSNHITDMFFENYFASFTA